MSGSRVFDPALQPERTQLAWRRTALSIAIGSIIALRILPGQLGDPLWYAPGVVGVLFAGYCWWASHGRYTAYNRWLLAQDAGAAPGGRSLAALAAFTAGFGIISAVAVVVVSAR